MRSIILILSFSIILFAQKPSPPPLADALWKAHLEITVTGQVRNHYLANRQGENGPIGFLKEKSKMKVDYTLDVHFLINSVGEVSLVSSTGFKASQSSFLEEKFMFQEEAILEGDIKSTQTVQMKETKETNLVYSHINEELRLPNGFLSILPSGRLDKKGTLSIEGNMLFNYQGRGSYKLRKERFPPSDEYAVLEENANINQTFDLPIVFSMRAEYQKKPVEVSISLPVDIANPFKDASREGKDIFTNNLKGTCRLSMVPLFGKYMGEL